MATCRRTQSPDTSHKPVKTNPEVSSVFPRLLHTSEVKNSVQQKFIIFAELDLKAKLGSARSNFITNLPKTSITMKLSTKSSSGIFKKVPEFLQRSTEGFLPTFSWMIWHHTGFRFLFSLFRVPWGVGDYGVVCLYVCLFLPAGSAILNVHIRYHTFRIFHRNFVTSTA